MVGTVELIVLESASSEGGQDRVRLKANDAPVGFGRPGQHQHWPPWPASTLASINTGLLASINIGLVARMIMRTIIFIAYY